MSIGFAVTIICSSTPGSICCLPRWFELFGFRTVSFHMGSEVSTIELAAKEIAEAQVEQAEQRANEIVREGRPVRIHFEEAESVQALRKPTQRSGTLRVIEIEGIDRSACGGTHVHSTAELGPIKIRQSEKIRNHTRLEFVCGARAVRRVKQDFRILLNLARQAAAPIDKLPDFLSVRDRLAEADKERDCLLLERAHHEGEALYDATAPSSDGLRRVVWLISQLMMPFERKRKPSPGAARRWCWRLRRTVPEC